MILTQEMTKKNQTPSFYGNETAGFQNLLQSLQNEEPLAHSALLGWWYDFQGIIYYKVKEYQFFIDVA